MIADPHLLDELATAQVFALAALAGATIAVSRRDYGVDGTLKRIVSTPRGLAENGYPVDFQLKGTTTVEVDRDELAYDLPVRNHDLLAARPATAAPYLLFVVCFPPGRSQWATVSETGLHIRGVGFHHAVTGSPSSNRRSVRVRLQRDRLLTASSLGGLLDACRREVRIMIDASDSLRAADGMGWSMLGAFLEAHGWAISPTRIDGYGVASKAEAGSAGVVGILLPTTSGATDETRRIADALRVLAVLDGTTVEAAARRIKTWTSARRRAVSPLAPRAPRARRVRQPETL